MKTHAQCFRADDLAGMYMPPPHQYESSRDYAYRLTRLGAIEARRVDTKTEFVFADGTTIEAGMLCPF